jgi:prophage DNA circulation protein
MAAPVLPATPQAFTFANLEMVGVLTAFTGTDKTRHVVHQFLKRSGARVEDMKREPRTLEVTLQLLGNSTQSPAQQFAQLVNHVRDNPVGLLVHPIAGKWQAFCHGPQHDVNYGRAVNQIAIRLQFTETELNAPPVDVPNTATAAQNVTTAQTQYEIGVAEYMGLIAKAEVFVGSALATTDTAIAQLELVEEPIDFMLSTLSAVYGATSALIGKLTRVSTKAKILSETVTNYVAQASDSGVFFFGNDAPVGGLQSVSTLLGNVETASQDLIDEMISVSPRNATSADAVGDTEVLTAACIVLADALKAARPPVISYTVPSDTDLLTLCQVRYRDSAQAHAAIIQSMNRILNPAFIPSGTVLLIPSK